MERIKDIMSRYAPFAWWVLMTLLAVFGIVAGALQGGFFGWQAYGEWLEAREGEK